MTIPGWSARSRQRHRVIAIRALSLALCFLISMPVAEGAEVFQSTGNRIEGIVTDQFGSPVSSAEVTVRSGSFSRTQTTDDFGRFLFEDVPGTGGIVSVRARGFSSAEEPWSNLDTQFGSLVIALEPARFTDEVTVTATRTEMRVKDTPASVVVLGAEDLALTSALTLDDAARQVAGFSLFRRSGSRTANPTAQGVSLRGVGASGASRAIVLMDGLPLNDPFGGWVYWGRVPRQAVNRLEVVRGGTSHLYGTDGLGGAINLITRREDPALAFETSYGTQQTPSMSLGLGGRVGQLGGHLAAEVFHTDGHVLVDPAERGRVDTKAGTRHSTLDLTLERMLTDQFRGFIRGMIFGESRRNGTPLQKNRTHIRQAVLGLDWDPGGSISASMQAYAGTQVFDQDFSAVAADRNTETLTRSQRVPARQVGLNLHGSGVTGDRFTLVTGVDIRSVRGASDEIGFFAGNATSASGSGGRSRNVGVFLNEIMRITRNLVVTAGARVDHWKHHDALSATRSLVSNAPPRVITFPDRGETAFSPRLSVLYRTTESISLTASAYRAFRAPTLNELYRSFRVGNIVTEANENLRAERLTGGEGGATVSLINDRLNLRGLFFWSETARTVANVTLSVMPELIVRRRENLGRTRSRGIEIEGDARITGEIFLSGGYQFVNARVVEFPASPGIEGLFIPQVPRHQLTAQATYRNSSVISIGLQARAVGAQFDDDQNRLRLGSFFVMDGIASRQVRGGLEVFLAIENLFNTRYSVGRTPVRTIGPPFFARIGLRFRSGGR